MCLAALAGCKFSEPKPEDLHGYWLGNDGEVFELNSDGLFVSQNLKGEYFFFNSIEFTGKKLSGQGFWKLVDSDGIWKVKLEYEKSAELPKGYATSIYVGGNGVLGNTPPWNLFVWENEEGGDRIILKKQEGE